MGLTCGTWALRISKLLFDVSSRSSLGTCGSFGQGWKIVEACGSLTGRPGRGQARKKMAMHNGTADSKFRKVPSMCYNFDAKLDLVRFEVGGMRFDMNSYEIWSKRWREKIHNQDCKFLIKRVAQPS